MIFLSFEDKVQEIRETSISLWEQVGEVKDVHDLNSIFSWYDQNISFLFSQSYIEKLIAHDVRLKEKKDFFEESGKPQHYPENGMFCNAIV